MGTDIHLWLEARDKKGNWFSINPRYVNLRDKTQTITDEYDVRRNYHLFAALANVRNEWGIPYIQENKGTPDDIAPETKTALAHWDNSEHNRGHVTLNDLEDYMMTYTESQLCDIEKAVDAVRKLYANIFFLCLNIENANVEDNDISLDKNNIRLVFWFDS